MLKLSQLNALDLETFTRVIGPAFEHCSWIAERTWTTRPWASVEELHFALGETVRRATEEEKLTLIQAHPDLVGNAVLTSESRGEQAIAGLGDLTREETESFESYNASYRERFGFPFVICARLNKKEAILHAFPKRLESSREKEIETALAEIGKIAELRLHDMIR